MRRRGAPLAEQRQGPRNALTAGPAKVEATLLELRGSGILIIPVPHAAGHHDVTLVDG